ncbi:MAG: PAS domain S-box protein [Deltaproteobacteria bacterium]|nr:PAS domain S-box protein [Candidatus Anaeroferrophillacea bacterium]
MVVTRSSHLFSTVLELVADAVLVVDPRGTILYLNRGAADLFGFSRNYLCGRPLGVLLPAVDGVDLAALLLRTALKKRTCAREIVLRAADTGSFPAHITLKFACLGPNREGFVVTVRDLTAARAMEARMVDARRMYSLGKLVDGISHEIRNPVLIISGFIHRLRNRIADEGPVHHYLDIIETQIDRMEHMVTDIEDYLHLVRNHRVRPVSVELPELLRDAFTTAMSFRREELEEVELRVADAAGIPPVRGDAGDLAVLFGSIIQNSVEAMQGHGVLEILPWHEDGLVHVRIRDNGRGIRPEKLKDIFDPFVTSKMSGAGIGLAKAFFIAEAHGGHIELESSPGMGTTVTVSLPADRRRSERRRARQ